MLMMQNIPVKFQLFYVKHSSGFEYDVFISYRHNDNRSGWVSEFVSKIMTSL